MTPEDEPRIAQALVDASGPPELAPQLVAIGRVHGLAARDLLDWISSHAPREWSAQDWTSHARHLAEQLPTLKREL